MEKKVEKYLESTLVIKVNREDEEVEKYLESIRDVKAAEEGDIYTEEQLEGHLEDDLISITEEGFMRGYLEG